LQDKAIEGKKEDNLKFDGHIWKRTKVNYNSNSISQSSACDTIISLDSNLPSLKKFISVTNLRSKYYNCELS
jgi:hypothetical protein